MKTFAQILAARIETLETRKRMLSVELGELTREIAEIQWQIEREERDAATLEKFLDRFGPRGRYHLALVNDVLDRASQVKRLRDGNHTFRAYFTLKAAVDGQFALDQGGIEASPEKQWFNLTCAIRAIMKEDSAAKTIDLRIRADRAYDDALRALRISYGFDRVCDDCGADWKSTEDDTCPSCARWARANA